MPVPTDDLSNRLGLNGVPTRTGVALNGSDPQPPPLSSNKKGLGMKFFQWLKQLIKGPPPAPTLLEGWRKCRDMVEQLDDLGFYLSQVNLSGMTESNYQAFATYWEKAEFALNSATDELKIHLNEIERLEQLAEINARVAKENNNVK